ncbi:long-chain-fatty-acid--CoA ligase [Subtercola boreus]|uniref:Long-chain fatty acid--CoA ligase n=1 Tax=Subtercola boreus TaxID=120213 RepID=A0A3E0WC14_9MICO|nr:long-chain fatty acid--CoA ligase [Subtercola boreus]RFA19872.1 long-chain fatty acid--CoA ligase [Subtercola boreus]RFA19939.1 long-chain fatty acid--CoA ligase [Subtercola boreus]RFA26332.1 long-chain fatty acid--CoA ligase [Subtercola boreus]
MSAGFATMSVASILVEAAKRTPDHVAIVVGQTHTTYAELWQQTRQYAGALRDRGVGPGTPVAMLIPNVADFPRIYYAVLSLGGVVVPIHALLKGKEIEYVLRDSGAELLVCAAPLLAEGAKGAGLAGVPVLSVLLPEADPALPPRLEDEARASVPIDTYVQRDPFDTATILYTSGTTGTPKGAEGSHLALVEQVNVSLLTTFDMKEGDRVLGALPLFHTFGQTCTMNTIFRAGATMVMVPKFDGDTALSVMNDQQCTIFMGVPTMYIALLDAASRNPDRPPLRYGISGGAAIPVAVINRFKELFGTEIHEGYGLTETSPVATFNMVGVPPRAGTIGTPIWGIDVEIADAEVAESIELLPIGELGELVIRGHNLMNGYHNRPEDTAKAMVDGWFRTGDLGRKDEDGYLTIVDRTKDMILRNGYNVYPREVEEVLAAHPSVSMVAVYGVPHETHGQEIIASVVLASGASATADELQAFVKEDVAAYKYPRHIDIVESLPLGPSGKVLKRELVAAYLAREESAAPVAG